MKRSMIVAAVAVALSSVAAPAWGHSRNGSHEEDVVAYPCPGQPDHDPAQPPPSATECEEGDVVYFRPAYDNDVTCGSDQMQGFGLVFGGAMDLATDGDSIWVEECSDDTIPYAVIDGRVVVEASWMRGLTVTYDGDKDNPGPAQGWVSVHVPHWTSTGLQDPLPSVACSGDGGTQDSDHRGPEDNALACAP